MMPLQQPDLSPVPVAGISISSSRLFGWVINWLINPCLLPPPAVVSLALWATRAVIPIRLPDVRVNRSSTIRTLR